jgi:hypothetical protein
VEVGAVASVGTEFSCQQPDESKLGPLTNPEGPEQLLFGVVDGERDGVRGGDWQRVPRGARGFRSKVLRIAAGSKSNRREGGSAARRRNRIGPSARRRAALRGPGKVAKRKQPSRGAATDISPEPTPRLPKGLQSWVTRPKMEPSPGETGDLRLLLTFTYYRCPRFIVQIDVPLSR